MENYPEVYILTNSQAKYITGAHIPTYSEVSNLTAADLSEHTFFDSNKGAWWLSDGEHFVGMDGNIYTNDDEHDFRLEVRLMLDINATNMHMSVGDIFYFTGLTDGEMLFWQKRTGYGNILYYSVFGDSAFRSRSSMPEHFISCIGGMRFKVISNTLALQTTNIIPSYLRYSETITSSGWQYTAFNVSNPYTNVNNYTLTNPYHFGGGSPGSLVTVMTPRSMRFIDESLYVSTLYTEIKSQYDTPPLTSPPVMGYALPIQYGYYTNVLRPDLSDYTYIVKPRTVSPHDRNDFYQPTLIVDGTDPNYASTITQFIQDYIAHPSLVYYPAPPATYTSDIGYHIACWGESYIAPIWDYNQNPATWHRVYTDSGDTFMWFKILHSCICIRRADDTLEQIYVDGGEPEVVVDEQYYISVSGDDSRDHPNHGTYDNPGPDWDWFSNSSTGMPDVLMQTCHRTYSAVFKNRHYGDPDYADCQYYLDLSSTGRIPAVQGV